MKFFGIGLPKTGTTTLGEYYKKCGINRFYGSDISLAQQVLRGKTALLDARLARHDAFEDHPWCMLYEKMLSRYPDAKYILTVRSSPEKWLNSCIRHCLAYGPQFGWKQLFGSGDPRGSESLYLDHYSRHISQVESFFAGKSSNLLKICFEDQFAHDKICRFLGKDPSIVARIWANPSASNPRKTGLPVSAKRYIIYYGRCAFSVLSLPLV
jgi:hypothetical protein